MWPSLLRSIDLSRSRRVLLQVPTLRVMYSWAFQAVSHARSKLQWDEEIQLSTCVFEHCSTDLNTETLLETPRRSLISCCRSSSKTFVPMQILQYNWYSFPLEKALLLGQKLKTCLLIMSALPFSNLQMSALLLVPLSWTYCKRGGSAKRCHQGLLLLAQTIP